jgi:hypothetical protein
MHHMHHIERNALIWPETRFRIDADTQNDQLTSVTFEMRQLVRLAHSEFRIQSEGRIIRLARLESLRNIQSGKLVAME